jgi:hypothetical protein
MIQRFCDADGVLSVSLAFVENAPSAKARAKKARDRTAGDCTRPNRSRMSSPRRNCGTRYRNRCRCGFGSGPRLSAQLGTYRVLPRVPARVVDSSGEGEHSDPGRSRGTATGSLRERTAMSGRTRRGNRWRLHGSGQKRLGVRRVTPSGGWQTTNALPVSMDACVPDAA